MNTRSTSARAGAFALMVFAVVAAALALAVGAAVARPADAFASTGYTATATPYYRNPATGVIEDSGGEDSEVLGQSMTEGCVSSVGFLEIDDAGNRYVTLRLGLMDNINNVNIMADDDWTNSYYTCSPQTIAVDGTTTDFRFFVGSEGAIFRINMYVVPMGREVIYYVALSNFVEGNDYGFYMEGSTDSAAAPTATTTTETTASQAATAAQSTTGSATSSTASGASPSTTAVPQATSAVDQQLKAKISEAENQLNSSTKSDDEKKALQEALDAAKAVQAKAGATDDEKKAATDKLSTALTNFKNALSTTSVAGSSDGIEEYDASGNKVSQDGSDSASVSIPVSTLVVGGVLLAIIVAGIVWFLGFYRPRHAGGPASAAVAAASPAAGAFRPYEAGAAVLAEEGEAPAGEADVASGSDQGANRGK